MAHMILRKSSIKPFLLTALVFTPLFLFSDGGVICSSYEDYDVQPTSVAWFNMCLVSYKVNGQETAFTQNAQATAPKTITLDDTTYINFMKFNKENTEIVSVSCGGLGSADK